MLAIEIAFIAFMVMKGAGYIVDLVHLGGQEQQKVWSEAKQIYEYTKGKDPEAYLILGHSSSNKPVSREQAYRVLRSAGHKIGLNSIGAQTMRKTYAWN